MRCPLTSSSKRCSRTRGRAAASSQAAQKENLPEHAPVERAVAKRVTRNHKIRTDTGIESTFPAEYAQNPKFIEFTSTSNGLIRIELKNIGSIENK